VIVLQILKKKFLLSQIFPIIFCLFSVYVVILWARNLKSMTTMRNHLHTAPILLGIHADELSLLCPETSSGGDKPFLNVVEPPLLGHHHAGLATPVPLRRVLWSSSPT